MCIYIYKKLRSPGYGGTRSNARKAKDEDDILQNLFFMGSPINPNANYSLRRYNGKMADKWLFRQMDEQSI